MVHNLDLAGKNALVTGGTRGIGQAIADALSQAGANVTITGTSPSPGIQAFKSSYKQVNFAHVSEIADFKNWLVNCNFDICVNNVGINKIGSFTDISSHDFESVITVNLKAPFYVCQGVLPYMRRQKWGRIVNISSIFGQISKEFRAPYSASKFGIDGLTAALAAEVGKEGILANCVSPGFIDTDLTRRVLGEQGIEAMTSMIPLKRLGTANEIANLVLFLASPLNTYISGQNYVIDGGFTRV